MERNTILITSVCVGLFIFGFVYNIAVAWLSKNNYDEGYTALLVVFGVGVTLMGIAIVDVNAAILSLLAFASSGTWMVAGSIWRHMQARHGKVSRQRTRRSRKTLVEA